MQRTVTDAQILAALKKYAYRRAFACHELGMSGDQLRARLYVLKKKRHVKIKDDPGSQGFLAKDAYMPTPEEVIAARDAIRDGWDATEEARRRVGCRGVPVELLELPDPLGGLRMLDG